MLGEGQTLRGRYLRWWTRHRVERALALQQRGEARPDGLVLEHLEGHLRIEWNARDVHPWDKDLATEEMARRFAEQCLDDTDSAINRLFENLPEVDVIEFRVIDPISACSILSGSVQRSASSESGATSAAMKLKDRGVRFRLVNWRFEPLA